MKEIILNAHKKTSKYHGWKTQVDDEDYEYLNQWSWQVKKHGNTFYARGADAVNKSKKLVYLHRIIFRLTDNSIEVDHIDHDGLNNLRNNLRVCSKLLNTRNKRKLKVLTSKYKGVCYTGGKWLARITIDKKVITLGRFDSEVDAAKAYNNASLLYHKEFGQLNII